MVLGGSIAASVIAWAYSNEPKVDVRLTFDLLRSTLTNSQRASIMVELEARTYRELNSSLELFIN